MKAIPQEAPISQPGPGITGQALTHTDHRSSQEQSRAGAGVGADTLEQIPELQDTAALPEPSCSSAPSQPGSAQNQSPWATAWSGSDTLDPTLRGLCSTHRHLHQELKFSKRKDCVNISFKTPSSFLLKDSSKGLK